MQPLPSEIHVPSTSHQVEQPELSDVQLARVAARRDWVSSYANEWSRLTNGRMDPEIAYTEGDALFHVVGHRPAEEIARVHFNSCTGATDTLTSATEKFRVLAVEVGLAEYGAELTLEQLEFAHGVAELCAAIGDQVRTTRDGSAGDLIRANYGPVPF